MGAELWKKIFGLAGECSMITIILILFGMLPGILSGKLSGVHYVMVDLWNMLSYLLLYWFGLHIILHFITYIIINIVTRKDITSFKLNYTEHFKLIHIIGKSEINKYVARNEKKWWNTMEKVNLIQFLPLIISI